MSRALIAAILLALTACGGTDDEPRPVYVPTCEASGVCNDSPPDTRIPTPPASGAAR